MKCQILFSGKNMKNIINLSSAENAQRVVKVKGLYFVQPYGFIPLTLQAHKTYCLGTFFSLGALWEFIMGKAHKAYC